MARGKQSEINRKKIEVDELNKRIRAAELELKVATASGKKDKASEIQSDINGLNSVIRELQDEIINFSDHEQIAAANHIQSHDDVIAKHVGLKKKYVRRQII